MTNKQNLKEVRHYSFANSSVLIDVVRAMQACEDIALAENEINVGMDIRESVCSHSGAADQRLDIYYLIRYGMVLERQRRAKDATHE